MCVTNSNDAEMKSVKTLQSSSHLKSTWTPLHDKNTNTQVRVRLT